MTKTKKILIILLSCVSIFMLSVVSIFIGASKVYAIGTGETQHSEQCASSQGNDGVSPYLFASLSLSLNGGNGKVWATVKNDFTLFPSTVYVIVQLYYSTSYCEDYNQMTLAVMNSTGDLNMGNTIVAEASTEGQERFWLARMRYRENSGAWKEGTVSARYSADGTYLGIT